MASKVYYTSARTQVGRNLGDKLGTLFDAAGFGKLGNDRETVALKLHWGEAGNLAFVAPQLVRVIVDRLKATGAKPFLTDTNTLYSGTRRNAVDNITTAIANGFGMEVTGAPIIVADGLDGHDIAEVEIPGKHFKKVKIAGAVHHSRAMVCISHFKGHIGMGFGGALKNLGMGCASPSGKQNIHSSMKPRVTTKKCVGCGTCVKWCPVGAITLSPERKASIDQKVCIGCGECTVVCLYEAIAVNWKSDAAVVQEKLVEYALGVTAPKAGRCGYINVITQVTPDCDCCNWSDTPIVSDIGIVASADPVAIDQASVDLVNKAPANLNSRLAENPHAKDKFHAVYPIDWSTQLSHGEAIGLGTRKYELVEVR